MPIINFVDTFSDRSIPVGEILNELEKNNYKNGRDFYFSYTNGSESTEGAHFLAKQAFRKTPAIVVVGGDKISEVAISLNSDERNVVIYFASKDFSKHGEIGFLNCEKKLGDLTLSQSVTKLLIQAIKKERLSKISVNCGAD